MAGQWASATAGLLTGACLVRSIVVLLILALPILGQHLQPPTSGPHHQTSSDHLSASGQQQSQSHHQAAANQAAQQSEINAGSSYEQQQLAQLGAGQQQSQQMNQISPSVQNVAAQQLQIPMGDHSALGAGNSRSRSPRSIGDMFKKLFNGNKRSKGSQGREWDQQQQQQQQQQQLHHHHQQQQNQAASMAASLAAAAANQHAVYASPFAAYSPQSSASALYQQFSPYSGAGLMAWPTTTNLAQALRATPTLIGPPSPASMGLAGSGPLYAAASQSYNSYAAPPAPQGPSAQLSAAAGNPTAAASHQHPSAVPAPPGMGSHGSGNSALDFHQVLDALVRTSGFAPAGDHEAAAASGYGAKTDGTPVFSFKKLVSLPFYLSTEEKPLEGLANAMGPGGYSLHSVPIMRRHVRRMSTPGTQQQQQQQQQQQVQHHQLPNLATLQSDTSQMQRSERAQQQHFSNYLNAINNQIASMSTNSQLMQYLSGRQSLPSLSSQMDAYSAEAALANYNALASLGGTPPYKAAGIGNRNGNASGQMQMAASMITPMAVQPPQGLGQPQPPSQPQQQQQHFHHHHYHQSPTNNNQKHQQQQQQQLHLQQQQQYEQDREIQSLLNSMQQQLSNAGDPMATNNSPLTSPYYNQAQSHTDGHRFDSQQQQQPQQQQQQQQLYQQQYPQQAAHSQHNFYWPTGGNQLADGSALLAINSNGNANNGQDYISTGQSGSMAAQSHLSSLASATPQAIASSMPSDGPNSSMGSAAIDHQQLSHSAQHQQQQQQQQQQQVAASGISQSSVASTGSSSSLASAPNSVDSPSSQQQQSALGMQQAQPQANLAAGGQRDSGSSISSGSNSSGGSNANNYGPTAQQIEGQQK